MPYGDPLKRRRELAHIVVDDCAAPLPDELILHQLAQGRLNGCHEDEITGEMHSSVHGVAVATVIPFVEPLRSLAESHGVAILVGLRVDAPLMWKNRSSVRELR